VSRENVIHRWRRPSDFWHWKPFKQSPLRRWTFHWNTSSIG